MTKLERWIFRRYVVKKLVQFIEERRKRGGDSTMANLNSPLARAILRGVRVLVALALAGGIAYVSKKPELLYLAPILSALAKYIRDVWKIDVFVL